MLGRAIQKAKEFNSFASVVGRELADWGAELRDALCPLYDEPTFVGRPADFLITDTVVRPEAATTTATGEHKVETDTSWAASSVATN